MCLVIFSWPSTSMVTTSRIAEVTQEGLVPKSANAHTHPREPGWLGEHRGISTCWVTCLSFSHGRNKTLLANQAIPAASAWHGVTRLLHSPVHPLLQPLSNHTLQVTNTEHFTSWSHFWTCCFPLPRITFTFQSTFFFFFWPSYSGRVQKSLPAWKCSLTLCIRLWAVFGKVLGR